MIADRAGVLPLFLVPPIRLYLGTAAPANKKGLAAISASPCSVITYQARATGLEPATTGSTVQYSNQLSYAPELSGKLYRAELASQEP